MNFKVWWMSEFTNGKKFEVEVASVEEGGKILETLVEYDKFQLGNNDAKYTNAGGLLVFYEETGEWEEWTNESGDDIWYVMFVA